tara:strand:+ start:15857 stop:16330 length:474 start_codon:yes stop_codon:yes gene_type:complete
MGFFSWKTQDTNRSIPSSYSERKTFPVTLSDDKGNTWKEPDYEGYGVFGGKDYYELLAEMNGRTTRNEGITLALGQRAIQKKDTKELLLADGIDFFNWGKELLVDGKSANQLVEEGDWVSIVIKERNVQFPNLNEDGNHGWKNEEAENCPDQGFFYD